MRITSSSIFSSENLGSERRGSDALQWSSFLRLFGTATAALFIGLVAAVILLDPFDTGRFALLKVPAVPEQGPRTANASRGRDPAFDGAIIGNSHIQLISPENLRRATGIPFVSLIVPATVPKEQFVLLDYFLRTRVRPPRALVFGIDQFWCRAAEPENEKPFPFWLYDPDPMRYLVGLIRHDALERLLPRLQRALGLSRKPRARPDGYWDYEQYRTWDAAKIGALLAARIDPTPLNLSGRFPSIEHLGRRLAQISAETAVVLVRPPVYKTSLSVPGTPLASVDAGCREALARIAAGRDRTYLVDWHRDRPENDRIENYFDPTHYRSGLARLVEAEIARALVGELSN